MTNFDGRPPGAGNWRGIDPGLLVGTADPCSSLRIERQMAKAKERGDSSGPAI
jgi:hypothetical protein